MRYTSGIIRSISINVKQEIFYGIRRHIHTLLLQLLKQQKRGDSCVSDKVWTEFMPQQNFKNKNNQNVCIHRLFPSMFPSVHRDCSFIYIILGGGRKVTLPLYFTKTPLLYFTKTNTETDAKYWEGREEFEVFLLR